MRQSVGKKNGDALTSPGGPIVISVNLQLSKTSLKSLRLLKAFLMPPGMKLKAKSNINNRFLGSALYSYSGG